MISVLFAAALVLPPTSGFTHSSGLDVVVVQQPSLPLVSVGVHLLDDPRQLPDLQREVAAQLLRSRVGDPEGVDAEGLRRLGGAPQPVSLADGTLWTFGVHPDDLPASLDRLAELLSRPLPVADRSGATWGEMPEHSAAGVHQLARARALGNETRPTPPVTGWERTFTDHAAAWVVPGNARFVVVGDVDEVELRKHLDHALASWPTATPPPLDAGADRNADSEAARQRVGLRGADRPAFAAAFRLRPGGLREVAAWILATDALGGESTWELTAWPERGLYSAAAQGAAESADALQAALLDRLAASAEGRAAPVRDRVRAARSRLLAGFDGRAGTVELWVRLRALGVRPGELPTLLMILDETTDADVAAFAKALLTGSLRVEVSESAE